MKRTFAMFAAASLLMIAPSAPTIAQADPPGAALDGIVERCMANVGNFPNESLGNCIGLITTRTIGANGTIPNICGFFQRERPDVFYYFYENFVDCVQDKASFGG